MRDSCVRERPEPSAALVQAEGRPCPEKIWKEKSNRGMVSVHYQKGRVHSSRG